jgi:hypothetical protein
VSIRTCSKVGSINASVSVALWRVNVLAPRAVELDGFLIRDVCETDREERLRVAVDARAAAKVGLLVLLHLCKLSAKRDHDREGNEDAGAGEGERSIRISSKPGEST